MKKFILVFISLIITSVVWAQNAVEVDMADSMRASGKIYVVIAVLTLIFLGIVSYLFLLDRKIGKLEREIYNGE